MSAHTRYLTRTEAKSQAEEALLQAIRATFAQTPWRVSQLCQQPGTAPAVRALADAYDWSQVSTAHVGRALHQMVRAGAPLARRGSGASLSWRLIESPQPELPPPPAANKRRPAARYASHATP